MIQKYTYLVDQIDDTQAYARSERNQPSADEELTLKDLAGVAVLAMSIGAYRYLRWRLNRQHQLSEQGLSNHSRTEAEQAQDEVDVQRHLQRMSTYQAIGTAGGSFNGEPRSPNHYDARRRTY